MTLALFFLGTLLSRLAGLLGVDAFDDWRGALSAGLALMFVFAAVARLHPGIRASMARMVPPALPRPELLVVIAGILEFAGAAGLWIPGLRTAAAVCLALLLAALFPANVYSARRRLEFNGKPATPLGRRAVEQIVYVAACVFVAL
ncbi:DoxX family protein [Salininema proteolyticum]|uniref:DoxX family protein n=1 Tax=Salininema proteolyticum TaxID=1607685 RepID=A0ABV8U4D2_9ACTN